MADISGFTHQDSSLRDVGSQGKPSSQIGPHGHYGQLGLQGQTGGNGGTVGQLSAERADTARIAQNLSVVAFRQWEKALTGLFSFPAAITLGAAATALYTTAFLERAFELFELSVSDIGSSVARDIQKIRGHIERGGYRQGPQDGSGWRGEFRAEVGQQPASS
jgi:hypothetical protein